MTREDAIKRVRDEIPTMARSVIEKIVDILRPDTVTMEQAQVAWDTIKGHVVSGMSDGIEAREAARVISRALAQRFI